MDGQKRKKKRTASEPWPMDDLQHDFDKIIRQAFEEGNSLTERQIGRIVSGTMKSAGKLYYRSLIESAPPMLVERRNPAVAGVLREKLWVFVVLVGLGKTLRYLALAGVVAGIW